MGKEQKDFGLTKQNPIKVVQILGCEYYLKHLKKENGFIVRIRRDDFEENFVKYKLYCTDLRFVTRIYTLYFDIFSTSIDCRTPVGFFMSKRVLDLEAEFELVAKKLGYKKEH